MMPEEVTMVTPDLILDLAIALTIVVLLTVPRILFGRMEEHAVVPRRRVSPHKQRPAHVRSIPRHAGLRHIKQTA